MTTQILLLGFAVGLVSIIPPGPVTMTLIEVGAAQGRRRGVEGGLGVAAGELAMAAVAAAVVLAGAELPDSVFAILQLLSSLVLLGLGLMLLLLPTALHTLALGITHPIRALFLVTTLNPTVLGAWVAIIAAMPFAADGASVAMFVIGASLASLAYHMLIGSAAGDFGHRATPRAMRLLSRLGGVAIVGFGLLTLVG